MSFNPYRVFKFVATNAKYTPNPVGVMCFNPYRVFKFVATCWPVYTTMDYHQFQSLSGFQVRCNFLYKDSTIINTGFQSLSGFQVRCNKTTGFLKEKAERFQSLSGFQVRCNVALGIQQACGRCSFNPYRVFKFVATTDTVSLNVTR